VLGSGDAIGSVVPEGKTQLAVLGQPSASVQPRKAAVPPSDPEPEDDPDDEPPDEEPDAPPDDEPPDEEPDAPPDEEPEDEPEELPDEEPDDDEPDDDPEDEPLEEPEDEPEPDPPPPAPPSASFSRPARLEQPASATAAANIGTPSISRAHRATMRASVGGRGSPLQEACPSRSD
jgi:hypothetical protein